MTKKEIVLGITASIAAYKAIELIKQLKEAKFNVDVVLTKNALKFITPFLLEKISNNRVYTDLFEERVNFSPEHISLAERADLILIAPATACIIGKLASGICDDLLSCVVLASNSPVLICPAMNENMYKNRIVQENIAKLKRLGYRFVSPIKGRLASGKIGIGHLAEVETIVEEVKRILKTI
jgi:phosphopantothenoylcysteine decarboxylase/phosphopantothenate--cysteine ligase